MEYQVARVLLCLLAATTCLTIDEHRPQRKDKRQLGYQISHHYSSLPSSYRLERRIATGPLQHYQQYHPYHHHGHPRGPYHKARLPSSTYPVPPYAVQMEPLVHYSQRDPLYDTNQLLSLDHPHTNDLLPEGNNHLENHHYGPPKPHIVERPVYIKEPEPIIEIIIKESNVSLPAPPPPPPPPKKKKEQVQVFYVKYQKNPHGKGKDAIIYDKPIPAISPKLPEEEEEEIEEAPYNYHTDLATAAPPPTTTLRTIIKPDSETYHSPSGVKVTFGKEGFDYDKRASKPDDYVPPQQNQQPQGRQLTSFSNAYFKRPIFSQNFPSASSSPRQPQTYRPITFPGSSSYKPFGRQQFPQQPPSQFSRPPVQNLNSFSSQGASSPHFSHYISHPPPPRFQNSRPLAPIPPTNPPRQPVPYTPFDKIKPQHPFPQPSPLASNQVPPHPQQQFQFRPESHFSSHQQLPFSQQNQAFKPPRFSQELQTVKEEGTPPTPLVKQQLPLQQEQHFFHQQPQQLLQQQLPHQQQHQSFYHQQNTQTERPFQPPPNNNQFPQNEHHNTFSTHSEKPYSTFPANRPFQNNNHVSQNDHQNTFQTHSERPFQPPPNNQSPQNDHLNILPPGGQLVQSVSKYEQHFSTVEPSSAKYQQKTIQSINSQENLQSFPQEQSSSQELLEQQKAFERQKQLLEERKQQQQKLLEEHRKRLQEEQLKQYLEQQESRNVQGSTPGPYFQSTSDNFVSSTARISHQITTKTPTTTTTEAATPSTTTKDPKTLQAQLPDEVPDELREQLLSSGILNNADISILDYDKVGDIPLSALPPDQLANFFNAGGAAQIASGSEPVASRLHVDGTRVVDAEEEAEVQASERREVKLDVPSTQESVDLKVVRYDPDSTDGKQVQEAYVDDTAETVNPVVLNDNSYNRYLPLKVNGTQFPIPDVPELKGRKISSVVVLAPLMYDFSSVRQTRETTEDKADIKENKEAEKEEKEVLEGAEIPNEADLIQDATLKKLLNEPTLENFKKFLESQNRTRNDQQSVILLVADASDPSPSNEKEIFMYDVATQTVSKLSGELSSAFVEAAEANASPEDGQVATSNTVETRVAFDRSDHGETTLIRSDLETGASSQIEKALDSIKTGQ